MVDRRTMRKPPTIRPAPLPGFARHYPVVAAIDCAAHHPAYALADGGELYLLGFDEQPGEARGTDFAGDINPDVAVVELSRSYGMKDLGKHGDIIAETAGGCLTAGSMRAGKIVFVHPDEWAGQTKKPPRHRQVWRALTAKERELVETLYTPTKGQPAALAGYIDRACLALAGGRDPKYTNKIHNILDVVGLLLFAVGRLGRGGAAIKPQAERPARV